MTRQRDDDDQISREDRLAGLLLLTGGRMPSWYARKKHASEDERSGKQQQPNVPPTNAGGSRQEEEQQRRQDRREQEVRKLKRKIAILLFVLATALKVLLFPSYRSTDFLVHRHWKALTRHLPRAQWYYDDRAVHTVHTLDYPPAFALLESFWSNAIFPILSHPRLLAAVTARHDVGLVHPQCLALVDDATVDDGTVVDAACVAFMRSTVAMSDLVWGYAAWIVSQQQLAVYALLLFHPALWMLDHIHFQYNGLLVAILLLSIHHVRYKRDCLAAVLIGLLVSLKHLYLTCCLWYVVVWMKRYGMWRKNPGQLLAIIVCGATPILLSVVATVDYDAPEAWLQQVVGRLFPFQRGLLHDYWAGNIWAFYAAAHKVLAKLSPSWGMRLLPMDAVTPVVAIGATLVLQLPSLVYVDDDHIWSSFVLTALASFLTQYHGHEKAILTALIPSIVVGTGENKTSSRSNRGGEDLCFHAAALVSLFPLLYESNERAFKIASTVCFLAAWQWRHLHAMTITSKSSATAEQFGRSWIIGVQPMILLALSAAVLQLDVLPTIGRFEFLKLIVVSLTCGSVFLLEYSWRLGGLMIGAASSSSTGPARKKLG
jgi:alpha-1,3-glucosyltransferase